ncbi:MAG TPA: helix-turn-helix domain-containing protein [Jatrophihabitantaceae bacterium]|nr:helix-turn-helix domain-containing protein [Jatrophihabitantaceae bacterium]
MRVPAIAKGQRISGADRDKLGKRLLTEYQAGKSIRQICAATGYSIGRVRRLLIDAGVEFRGRGGRRRTTVR